MSPFLFLLIPALGCLLFALIFGSGVRRAWRQRRRFGALLRLSLCLAFLLAGLGLALLGGAILGVNANQPAIFLTASVILFTISALATVLPARRAMQIDPILALRVER